MASAYFGLNRGQTEFTGDAAGTQGVTESASASGSTDVEIRVDLTKSLNKNEVVMLVNQLNSWILKNKSKFLPD
jgi:hypothetical protein